METLRGNRSLASVGREDQAYATGISYGLTRNSAEFTRRSFLFLAFLLSLLGLDCQIQAESHDQHDFTLSAAGSGACPEPAEGIWQER